MYITKCCAYPNFQGKIIDTHVHTGNHEGKYFDRKNLEPFFKKLPNGDVVEKMIVSDLDVLTGTQPQRLRNEYIMKHLADTNKYAIIASCNVKENVNDLRGLLQDNKGKFVGLKFHPHIQEIPINDAKYKPYFEVANEQKLPCLIHSVADITKEGKLTGKLEKFSDPKSIYEVAKNYKETPFVMAHLGSGWKEAHKYTTDVIIDSIKKGDANLYADFSWVNIDSPNGSKDDILNAIKRLKGIGEADWKYGDQSFRLMFGSDAPIGRFQNESSQIYDYNKYIEEIKTAIKNDKDLKADAEKIIDDIFYNNAKKLYNLTSNEQPSRKISTSEKILSYLSKNIGKLAIGAGALFVGILALCYHSDNKEKNKPNLSLVG